MLHNTLTEDRLNLFCLVDGKATSNAFSVKPTPADTVGDLKDIIKAKKINDFSDIAANKLTLWLVSIPIDDDHDEIPVVLGNVINKDEKKLRVTRKLSDVWKDKPPKGTIHVIIQRPPQVHRPVPARVSSLRSAHAWDRSRSATPIKQKVICQDGIKKELAIVLEDARHHHITHAVDPKAVEASQRERLATNTSLVMLGLELDKQARTSNGDTLYSIVKDDIGKFSGHRVVAMDAPFGSGKTATVIDLASKHFVVYCVCCPPDSLVSTEFKDINFIQLAEEIESMYRTIIRGKQGVSRDPQDIDFEVKLLARERVELEFLARLLFLQLLLHNNPDLEPQQFFREQITGCTATIRKLVHKLREYRNITIEAILREVQIKLHLLLVPKRRALVIALDEAQVAANGILSGKLISPSALVKNRDNPSILFDAKNQIQPRFRRGFLTPLTAALSNIQATLVILGTALLLHDVDNVHAGIDNPTNFIRITDFPQFDEDDVNKMLSDLVDLSGCGIPPAKRRKLSGRARFSIGIINRLIATGSIHYAKQATLDKAVDYTIEHMMSGLRSGIRTLLEGDKTGDTARLLSRMVLAYHLQDAKISFSSNQQSDFVGKALCRLRQHLDGVHLIMDEPIVVEAVEEELKVSGKDRAFSEYMDQVHQIVANFGASLVIKGTALETLVRRSLQRFSGIRLVDLPFLQGVVLPDWCHNLQLQIDDINTAGGLGYMGNGAAADLAFLTSCPPSKMLVASSGTRPDGVWFFPDKQYAGSLAIKLYSNPLTQNKHKENETSSDLRCCFLQKDGKTLDPSLTDFRRAFETSGTPSNLKGILRIHLEFPCVQGHKPVTYVKKDSTTGVEDVMVYIDLSNMDSFFDEGVEGNRDDMVKLKKLIKFVSTSA